VTTMNHYTDVQLTDTSTGRVHCNTPPAFYHRATATD